MKFIVRYDMVKIRAFPWSSDHGFTYSPRCIDVDEHFEPGTMTHQQIMSVAFYLCLTLEQHNAVRN